jgi:hypothetical protein
MLSRRRVVVVMGDTPAVPAGHFISPVAATPLQVLAEGCLTEKIRRAARAVGIIEGTQ